MVLGAARGPVIPCGGPILRDGAYSSRLKGELSALHLTLALARASSF